MQQLIQKVECRLSSRNDPLFNFTWQSIFVDLIRKNLLLYDIDEAVEVTINYCIEHGILAEFLRKNKAEVIPRMIYECNMEEEIKKISDDRYEDGYVKGSEDGYEKGYDKGSIDTLDNERSRLICKHLENNKTIEEIADILFLSVEEVKKYV